MEKICFRDVLLENNYGDYLAARITNACATANCTNKLTIRTIVQIEASIRSLLNEKTGWAA